MIRPELLMDHIMLISKFRKKINELERTYIYNIGDLDYDKYMKDASLDYIKCYSSYYDF